MSTTGGGSYVLCTECTHTTLIHNEHGCHAYMCSCKKGH